MYDEQQREQQLIMATHITKLKHEVNTMTKLFIIIKKDSKNILPLNHYSHNCT